MERPRPVPLPMPLVVKKGSVAFARVATPNADRRFARLAVDLIDELRDGREPARFEGPPDAQAPPLQGFSINGALCTPECGKP